MENVRQMKYSWRVIQESLRMYPTLPGLFRQATTTFEYKGYTIPEGWKIYVGSKQPKFFENPEKFDPSRFDRDALPPFSHFPYGGGVRICPGMDMSKVIMLVFFYYFMKNIKWEVVNPEEKVIYSFGPGTKSGSSIRITKSNVY